MSITLNTKVYNFRGFLPNGVSRYLETSGGVPASFSPLTNIVADGKSKTDVRWRLELPVTATVDSECACVGDVLRLYRINISVEVPPGSLAAERTDVNTRIANLVASPEFQASITSLVQPAA